MFHVGDIVINKITNSEYLIGAKTLGSWFLCGEGWITDSQLNTQYLLKCNY